MNSVKESAVVETKISPFPILISADHGFLKYIPQWLLNFYHTVIGPPKPRINGIFMEFGKFVWIQNKESINDLYKSGSFGKGDLSRSNPTWFTRTVEQDKNALEEITVARRKKRRQKNKKFVEEQESKDMLNPSELLNFTSNLDVEVFQLDLYESFFLKYALNALSIVDTKQKEMPIEECWSVFCNHDKSFHINYAVYHYYRSLGWVPKNGIKFGVDFVLYKSGPAFRHADYAVIIIPIYQEKIEEPKTWSWFLRLNRVCTQVKKTLILCYVHIPSSPSNLHEYSIRQVIYKRWSPQRNRE